MLEAAIAHVEGRAVTINMAGAAEESLVRALFEALCETVKELDTQNQMVKALRQYGETKATELERLAATEPAKKVTHRTIERDADGRVAALLDVEL